MDAAGGNTFIGKIDSEVDPLLNETTELKNVVLVIENHEAVDDAKTVIEQLIGNSDGNLKINTIQRTENVIIPIEDASSEQPDEDEDVAEDLEDGGYINDDKEDSVNNGDVADEESAFFERERAENVILINENTNYSQHSTTIYIENEMDFEENTTVEEDEEVKYEYKDEAHPCPTCQRIFKTTASLRRHVSVAHAAEEEENDDPLEFELCLCCAEPVDSAHRAGDYKCKQCDKLFVHYHSLLRHESMEHSADGNWKCVECNNVFAERALLLEHMQTHPFNKVFVCRHCGREFTRKYHLERHTMQTGCDGNPRSLFECQVCNKEFSRKDNLREHLRAHAGQSKPRKVFVCSFCKKEFRGSSLLAIHLRTHTGEKPYSCDLCPKRFPSSGAMRKHRRMHTGEKPYQCTKCQNTFAAKETLNRHTRTHTGDRPHGCHFCGKTFIQAAQLRAHIFHHTGENAYTCPHCNRAFNRRNRLTQHIKFVHEGAQPMECKHCKKSFYRKEDLLRHGNLHSGIRPYRCELCNKSFSIKSSLKLHMLTHRKEEPCSCDVCGRAFIRQDCLMRHMRSKHRSVLEDIMAGAEKKRLQQQLLNAASDAAKHGNKVLGENTIWNELSLTDSVKELLGLLVDESTLKSFGWPDTQVDKLLDSVIKRCGHKPASEDDFDYLGRMRENVKILFTVVIDDEAVNSLLNNQTVDEVILHVLRLAK